MLTRSFIQSILIVTQKSDAKLKNQLESGLKTIYEKGYIDAKEPSGEEKEEIKTKLEAKESQLSLADIFMEICTKLKISSAEMHKLLISYTTLDIPDTEINKEKIAEWIKFTIKQMKGT
jgi:hypothetical protein